MKLILGLALGLIGWSLLQDEKDAALQAAEYCEMVELWQRTNGQAGWPDYKADAMPCP